MRSLLRAINLKSADSRRFIVALAGAPGAGKSTLAEELANELPNSRVLPMDGFHYDNSVLDQLGLRSQKGAPETFDYPGFAAMLQRIRDAEPNVAIPLFDRTMDLARAGAALIPESVKFIVAEGNYLLLDESPWSGLAGYFDLTVFLYVPRPELHRRLMHRWLDLGRTPEQAAHWVNSNDMPNVDRVLAFKRLADFDFHPDSQQ